MFMYFKTFPFLLLLYSYAASKSKIPQPPANQTSILAFTQEDNRCRAVVGWKQQQQNMEESFPSVTGRYSPGFVCLTVNGNDLITLHSNTTISSKRSIPWQNTGMNGLTSESLCQDNNILRRRKVPLLFIGYSFRRGSCILVLKSGNNCFIAIIIEISNTKLRRKKTIY